MRFHGEKIEDRHPCLASPRHVRRHREEKGIHVDADRERFLERLGEILHDTKTTCYAWALIPSHFHLLLRTGPAPVSTMWPCTHSAGTVCSWGVWRGVARIRREYWGCSVREWVQPGVSIGSMLRRGLRRGSGEFVEGVLRAAEEAMENRYALRSRGFDLEKTASRVAEVLGVKEEEVWAKGRYRPIVEVLSLLCYRAVRELGVTMASLAGRLEISIPAVSKSVSRGKELGEGRGYSLPES